MAPADLPQRRPWRWPLRWLFASVFVVVGGIAGWAVGCLLYGNKIPAGYLPYFFAIGPGLLLVLASVGLLALMATLTHAFRKQWRQALVWFLLCTLSSGSCVIGYFPVVLVQVSGIADDGHQNE